MYRAKPDKFKILIPKSETNPKIPIFKCSKRLEHLSLGNSIFVFPKYYTDASMSTNIKIVAMLLPVVFRINFGTMDRFVSALHAGLVR